jgi:hypothetical protein|nr:MAG TPA: Regulatory protein [Caudoviricetes sp.]
MKLDILKNKIFENRKTYKDCAEMLNISVTAFSNKMNGHTEFKVTEVINLAEYLSLSSEDCQTIFFNK